MRSKAIPSDALPFTRPDSLTSLTAPVTCAPFGTAVVPSITIGDANAPLTTSSTWLVFDARLVSTDTLSDVPAGMVTSLNAGGGGGGGGSTGFGAGGGGAAAATGAGSDAGVVARVDVEADFGGAA